MIATVVDWKTLGESVLYSLVGGIGLTTAFSLAIAGATRSYEMARDGRRTHATAYAALAGVAVLVCLGAVAVGIYYTTKKS
ncbi:MAG: hypothetical protein ACJ76V_10940 [Thermoleophilaceae bacterium]